MSIMDSIEEAYIERLAERDRRIACLAKQVARHVEDAKGRSKRIAELKRELEHERIRLAACGVAATANTEETVRQRLAPEHTYYSASYGDVCAAVDREMKYRADNDRLAAEVGRLRAALGTIVVMAENYAGYEDIRLYALKEAKDAT